MECLEQLVCAKLDKAGDYVYVSQLWLNVMGLSSQDVLGRHVAELVPDTHAVEAMESGQIIRGRPVMRQGIPIFTNYIPLKDKTGKVRVAAHKTGL